MTEDSASESSPTWEDITAILADRGATLEFLSRLYEREPEPEMLGPVLHEIRQWPAATVEESRGQALLRSFALQSRTAHPATVAADLSAEYVSMFFSSWRRVVSPYESVYVSQGHAMMQEPAADLKQLYLQEGLQVDPAFTEPADHIALELAFLSFLCRRALTAAQGRDRQAAIASLRKQQRFLNEHLLPWATHFCQDLAEATKSGFYRGLAWLTAEFLEGEMPLLDELLQRLTTGIDEESSRA